MNDKELRQNVIEELDFEPSVDSADIGVAAESGVVTLTGHVPNYAQKLAAERATWRVDKVKAIAQDIEVRFGADRAHNDDDEIAQRAINILAWNVFIPNESVRVKVEKGWVTLTGQLEWNYQREAAESGVRELDGVAGVSNDVVLKATVQQFDVKQRITDALKRHAEVEASRIQVSVLEGGAISLTGDVDNWDERQAVVRAVWSASGVCKVDDHLRIR